MSTKDTVRWAIVGCGGMARRHLRGLAYARAAGLSRLELGAVCDLNERYASLLADEAKELLGVRPAVFTSVDAMVGECKLDAADVVTDLRAHHTVTIQCLEAGLHVLCEKPMALTMAACDAMVDAARRMDRLLSVAENFPRYPAIRLARALLADGAIGTPRLMQEVTIRGRDEMVQTPWRHTKLGGTVAFDSGVHNAAMFLTLMGEATSVHAETRLHERVRRRATTSNTHGRAATSWWQMQEHPPEINATGEDAIYGLVTFASGAVGQWTLDNAGHGESVFQRRVFGSKGSLDIPRDRSGEPLRVHLDDGTVIADERLTALAPSYRLDPFTANAWGSDRPWRHDFDFQQADERILGLQFHEMNMAISEGQRLEVPGDVGRLHVALCLGALESGLSGATVMTEDVVAGRTRGYQSEIDAHLATRVH